MHPRRSFAVVPALLMLVIACEPAPAPPAHQSPATSSSTGVPSYIQTVSMKQLMEEVFEPAAQRYWDAVGWVMDQKGTVEIAPKTPEEWIRVRDQATVLAEVGNLLLMEGRALDRDDWVKFAQGMIRSAANAREAAAARDKMRVFDAGAELYESCVQCHATYLVPKYPLPPPWSGR